MYQPGARCRLSLSARKRAGSAFKCMVVLLCAPFFSATAVAASLGMVTDNESDVFRIFDAETDLVLASFEGSEGRISGDCELSRDE